MSDSIQIHLATWSNNERMDCTVICGYMKRKQFGIISSLQKLSIWAEPILYARAKLGTSPLSDLTASNSSLQIIYAIRGLIAGGHLDEAISFAKTSTCEEIKLACINTLAMHGYREQLDVLYAEISSDMKEAAILSLLEGAAIGNHKTIIKDYCPPSAKNIYKQSVINGHAIAGRTRKFSSLFQKCQQRLDEGHSLTPEQTLALTKIAMTAYQHGQLPLVNSCLEHGLCIDRIFENIKTIHEPNLEHHKLSQLYALTKNAMVKEAITVFLAKHLNKSAVIDKKPLKHSEIVDEVTDLVTAMVSSV